MFYTDPKTKKVTSFDSLGVVSLAGEVWIALFGAKSDKPVKTVKMDGDKNAKAAYLAARKRKKVSFL